MKHYSHFLDLSLDSKLLKSDGLVLADNVLFRGLVGRGPDAEGGCSGGRPKRRMQEIAEALHQFNVKFLEEDPRTDGVILEEDDGLAVIWRKS